MPVAPNEYQEQPQAPFVAPGHNLNEVDPQARDAGDDLDDALNQIREHQRRVAQEVQHEAAQVPVDINFHNLFIQGAVSLGLAAADMTFNYFPLATHGVFQAAAEWVAPKTEYLGNAILGEGGGLDHGVFLLGVTAFCDAFAGELANRAWLPADGVQII